MILTAILHKDEEWFVAECTEVGTASQGENHRGCYRQSEGSYRGVP